MCALLHNLSTSDLNKRDHEGMTALHWGAFHNRPDHVRILLERGADIFREDIDGKTALHWAAQKGNLQCCELLYKWKDGVLLLNHTDHAGKSPVHFAAAAGNLAVIREFASVDDCDLEAEDPDDRTPLHWAVATGQTACVCLLLEIGVAPNPVDIEGCSPLDYARLSKHKECQKILEEKLGLNSVSRPLGTNLPQFKISPVPGANKTSSKVSFFRNLFGKSSKKRSNIHEAASDISNCDMKSYDMALMREEHLNGREETMNPISNLESQESSIQRETTIERDNVVDNPNNHLPYETNGCDQSSESKEYTAHTKDVDSLHEKTDHCENVTFDKGDNSPNLKVNDELPHVTRRVSINLEGEEVLSDPKFRAPAGLQPDLPVPVRRVQSLQPVPVSQSHEPVKQALTSPSLPRRALGGDLAPLKGPKPPTGLTIHEKVIALRMEKTGPARSPTPPSWVERSFDPLSPRQQPGRSPLLAAENRANKGLNIPSQMEVHRRGSKTITRASVDLTNAGQPPLYLECGAHSSMSKGSNSSDGDSRHNSGTSSPITKKRPEKCPRRPTGGQRSNAATGVFSAQERKQLDKQLHNLLL